MCHFFWLNISNIQQKILLCLAKVPTYGAITDQVFEQYAVLFECNKYNKDCNIVMHSHIMGAQYANN